jgi:DNA-directed RNA polymerase specialized sigma24 family protein
MDRRRVDAASSDGEFSEFAAAAHSRLRNTAYLLCGDWERAADHVQEGLICSPEPSRRQFPLQMR